MKHFNKVVACVLIDVETTPKILAFEHPPPLSDYQIPKGTIEANEIPEIAVLRELEEESGIKDCRIIKKIGSFNIKCHGGHNRDLEIESQSWNVYHIELLRVPQNEWTHKVTGSGVDSGLQYRYFWFEINDDPKRFHPKFLELFRLIQSYLN